MTTTCPIPSLKAKKNNKDFVNSQFFELMSKWINPQAGKISGRCECGERIKYVKTFSEKYGTIYCVPMECNKCRETAYQSHMDNYKNEKFQKSVGKCCGFQNVMTKQKGKVVMYEDIRDGFSYQEELSNYVSKILDDQNYGSAYIEGSIGTGKTFWCKVLHNTLVSEGLNSCFIRAVDLAIALRKETFGDHYKTVLKEFYSVPVLIIDDFGTQKNTEWVSETIFSIIDKRYEEGKTTIITSNLSILSQADNKRLASRLADRAWMKTIKIQGRDARLQNLSWEDI